MSVGDVQSSKEKKTADSMESEGVGEMFELRSSLFLPEIIINCQISTPRGGRGRGDHRIKPNYQPKPRGISWIHRGLVFNQTKTKLLVQAAHSTVITWVVFRCGVARK